eukprot:9028670-Pyramimonas_sp.AAC.1
MLLPHDGNGARWLRIRYDLLGLEPPQPPPPMRHQQHDGIIQFTPGTLRKISDQLRAAAKHLDRSDDMDAEEYNSLEDSILLLDAVAKQLSPAELHKEMVDWKCGDREPGGDAALGKMMFIIKAFMLSNLLRDSGNMQKSIMYAINLALPPALVNIIREYVKKRTTLKMKKYTISRWRMLLDGMLLLYGRDLDDNFSVGEGCFRFFMADSSMQRGRDFQLVQVVSLPKFKAAEMLTIAQIMISFRRQPIDLMDINGDDDGNSSEAKWMEDLSN